MDIHTLTVVIGLLLYDHIGNGSLPTRLGSQYVALPTSRGAPKIDILATQQSGKTRWQHNIVNLEPSNCHVLQALSLPLLSPLPFSPPSPSLSPLPFSSSPSSPSTLCNVQWSKEPKSTDRRRSDRGRHSHHHPEQRKQRISRSSGFQRANPVTPVLRSLWGKDQTVPFLILHL